MKLETKEVADTWEQLAQVTGWLGERASTEYVHRVEMPVNAWGVFLLESSSNKCNRTRIMGA